MSTIATTSTCKRALSQCSNQLYAPCSPSKKRRTSAYLKSIEGEIPVLTDCKLRVNPRESTFAANDCLFLNPMGTVNEKYMRWVLACKFTIAANWKVDGNRIPDNMHFFVDDQKNLCALIVNEHSNITRDVVQHCRQIETSVVRKYRRRRTSEGNGPDSVQIDDLLKVHRQTLALVAPSKADQDEMMYSVRIPAFYYDLNLQSSFYALCCRTAQHLQQMQHYGHPLFQILFKNIANFDSFQLTVPTVPLRGSLYAMFCQFALGVTDHHNVKRHHIMNRSEFRTFLGLYDCWREKQRRAECRKIMYQCWAQTTGTELNVMGLIVDCAGLDEIDDGGALQWAQGFERKSTEYKRYKAELRAQITNLKVIVDFHSK